MLGCKLYDLTPQIIRRLKPGLHRQNPPSRVVSRWISHLSAKADIVCIVANFIRRMLLLISCYH